MKIRKTTIAGLLVLEPQIFHDERGSFHESYNAKEFHALGIVEEFVQDNLSVSNKNVIRGMHFQLPPFEQGKIVQVVRGRALDVAVDLRKDSPTLGKHFSIELSGENHFQLWIPPGFAHGFASLEDHTVFSYKVTHYYHRDAERGIRYNDPDLNISWPVDDPVVSGKDRLLPSFREWMKSGS